MENQENKCTLDKEKIVFEYKKTLQQKRIARMVIAGALIFSILISVFSMFRSAKYLLNEGMGELVAELGTGMKPVTDQGLRDLGEAFTYLSPIYQKEFSDMFEENLPLMREQLFKEIEGIEEYAIETKPKIDEAVRKLAFNQQRTIHDNLVKLVGEEKADEVAELYKEAMPTQLNRFFMTNFVEYQDLIDQIRLQLDRILLTEPDISSPVLVHEALGLSLELAGIKMQELEQQDQKL